MDTQLGETTHRERSMDKPTKTDKRRLCRAFTRKHKTEAVRLCKTGGRSIAQFAMNLDSIETSLRE